MSRIHKWMVWVPGLILALAGRTLGADSAPAPSDEGVALAIVYDTSGSMQDAVPDSAGRTSPKYLVANRAFNVIVDRLQDFVAKAPKDHPRLLETGLYTFDRNAAKAAIPMGPFSAPALRQWLSQFSSPSGPTPLGDTVRLAAQAVMQSKMPHKHVVVITDGMNTAGADPVVVLRQLNRDAEKNNSFVFYHFVAFDIAARVFDPLKKLGATVVGASNAVELKEQLEFIIEQKVLLEAETPPAGSGKKK